MKYFFIIFFFAIVVVLSVAGFRGDIFHHRPLMVFPDMDDQPKVLPQETSNFFADGAAARKPVPGTIPVGFEMPSQPVSSGLAPLEFGFTHADDYFNTGRIGDFWGDGLPEEIEVTPDLIARGKERFEIHCAICHGKSGNGQGVTAKYGIPNIANFHDPRFTDSSLELYVPDGSLFHTITYGKGLMGPYGANIIVRDRWAIIAYIRALQSGQQAAPADAAPPADANAAPVDDQTPAPAADAPEPDDAAPADEIQ